MNETMTHKQTETQKEGISLKGDEKLQIIYLNLVIFGYGHLAALYGLYLAFTTAKWSTLLLAYFVYSCAGFGVTAGAHRLWAHRAYRATRPLQILLMLCNCCAFQNSAVNWVRDHRLHHKYSDTDADPHNSRRGLFYSHIGWLLVRKNEQVKRKGKTIDMSDIHSNPVLVFQKRYAIPMFGLICFALPTLVPVYFFHESLNTAWHVTMFRYILSLHSTFLTNSIAHRWGYRPYDADIAPAQNIAVAIITYGEGFHNYHHAFPWDYRTAELGNWLLNPSTVFIDFFAWLGWAYDLKTAPDGVVDARKERTGDGSGLWGRGGSRKRDGERLKPGS